VNTNARLKWRSAAAFSLCLISAWPILGADKLIEKHVAIEWLSGRPQGQIRVDRGNLLEMKIARGKGTLQGPGGFQAIQEGPFRMELRIQTGETALGKAAPIVSVVTTKDPFSFFLRDVSSRYPIWIPAYNVVATLAEDQRSYLEIQDGIRSQGLQTNLQRIESEPEESYQAAARDTRSLSCQTWLGLSRDIRIFGISERMEWIQPRFHGHEVSLPETGGKSCRYEFLMGRGWGAVDQISRRLEEGTLPILRGALLDDDVAYDLTAFVTMESSPLSGQTLRGTHFLVADGYGIGHMFTPEQQAQHDSLLPAEMNPAEETVLYLQIQAVNRGLVPRYAFFKGLTPSANPRPKWSFDGAKGFGTYESGRVFSVSTLNGKPLTQNEAAVRLNPGETATFEIKLPHRPISAERAGKLAEASFAARRQECRQFWRKKLEAAAGITLPEQRITEMARAGLLHLDLITYGLEPKGTLTSTIGVYSAIGSESSPIIQFIDSMGWHDVARRALTYFLDKQHDDGFMQNFGGYMLETGAALWSLGEHYRYTRDEEWVKSIAPKLVKACEYLLKWRQRNQREELRGKGYGLLEGKTADPEDPFHSFMLNGYACLGLSRAAEMLAKSDPAQSQRWQQEAAAFKADIRTAFFEAMGRAPVIPLGDGSWCPTVAPWVEYRGPLVLHADGGDWFTHGAMVARDSLLGPLYLVFQEVLDAKEPGATFLLNFHSELMTKRNVAFSQPYYSRHPIVHLRRGEVKPFLKSYYNTMASLADRETYTFWEHYFGASPHKTHEEGWFLMQTRWMLYLEKGETLELLPGIPRGYLENGKEIELKNVASYFGPVSLHVKSSLDQGRVEASVECLADRRPKTVALRLPHPQGKRAVWVQGGAYDPETERVKIEPFSGRAAVVLGFGENRQ